MSGVPGVNGGVRVTADQLIDARYDEVVLCTGVTPRDPRIPGQDHPSVLSYVDVLLHKRPVGPRVAVVGAGGIGFDVAEYLTQVGPSATLHLDEWMKEWGVGDPAEARDGIAPREAPPAARQIVLLQRKASKPGAGLGKTTGWIHRAALNMKQVEMIAGANYERIDARDLHQPLVRAGIAVHLVGGADVASGVSSFSVQ
ncbi:FAD-dependent oxidoreductase (plasmid) [Alicycliphilus denitrificans]|uniref:FAD-dependent oxidoreductase n=1 Tax=Alicycliphilus denitrificans TaxID=179636 RepID=A0A858ZMT5_9BURK|nr:FAD-dependent oxidoreductase [Alicycliphilus denitrificans]QKD42128.1 FAD-dependent oxidoreductase [Alicycliphilus denitrificans]